MRWPLGWVGFLLFVTTTAATAAVRIKEVGLQGYFYNEPIPTPVRVVVTNPQSQAQRIELRCRLISPRTQYWPGRVDSFSYQVNLAASEQREVEIPVLLAWTEGYALEAEARGESGELVGQDARAIERPLTEYLVAIVCGEQPVCQAAQAQVNFSGTLEEQNQKGKLLKIVIVQQPPPVWWGYAAAHTVVAAFPLAGMSAEQRAALEEYARQGGRLVLVEDSSEDAQFLSAYRRGATPSTPQVLGRGKLYRIRSLRSQQLASLFTSGGLLRLVQQRQARLPEAEELSYVRKRLATSFEFPGIRWLLGWLAVYILAVGLVNFVILRLLGRREWGWVTVPVLALLFAGGFYVKSAAKRPKNFELDTIAIYWLDDRSGKSASELGLRVSSPRRSSAKVVVPGDAVFAGFQRLMSGTAVPFFNVGFSSTGSSESLNAQLGPPRQLEVKLLQWSFRDLNFKGAREFAGTVHRAGGARLRNESGHNFREALYVDPKKVYFLGSVSAGVEIDLNAARQDDLNAHSGRTHVFFGYPSDIAEPEQMNAAYQYPEREAMQREFEEWKQLPRSRFALDELIRGWPRGGGKAFEARTGIFFGLSDEPVPEAQLAGLNFARKSYALTIVSFGREQ